MVNFKEIYGVVKYRTALGEGGISAYTATSCVPLEREVLAGGRLPPLRRVMYVQ